MSQGNDRFQLAIAAFDDANAADPNRITINGQDFPAELIYAQWMTEVLNGFHREASEPLRLAARANHIRRWMIPRKTYPNGKLGYLQWRTALGSFHAKQAGRILRDVGYDNPTVTRVESIIRKEKLKADPDTQALEDVICLVFLEHELAEFMKKQPEEKIIPILQKTWRKMSPRGREAASALLSRLPKDVQSVVQQATSTPAT
jgi:hypothetical protein